MPNPIKSAVQDYVTSTITHKFLGSNSSNRSGQQQQPSNNQHNLPGAVGDIFGKITTTIGNKLNPSNTHQQRFKLVRIVLLSIFIQKSNLAYPPACNAYPHDNSAPPLPIGFNVGVSSSVPPYPQQSAYNQPAGQYTPYPLPSGQYGGATPYPTGGGGFEAQQPQQQYFGGSGPNQKPPNMSGNYSPYGSDPFGRF
uniref:Uncharacterized protein n=1 Tax=Meloidogyne hapla TaxID=6305 RepID=A0A1I8BPE2_MELHA